jgi:hypothetical protein
MKIWGEKPVRVKKNAFRKSETWHAIVNKVRVKQNRAHADLDRCSA